MLACLTRRSTGDRLNCKQVWPEGLLVSCEPANMSGQKVYYQGLNHKPLSVLLNKISWVKQDLIMFLELTVFKIWLCFVTIWKRMQ